MIYGGLRHPAWLATAIENWHWNGYSWDLCAASDWLYNQSITSSNSYSWQLGLACGNGWYGTYGGGYVWRNNSEWDGGWVWSGYEYVVYNTLASASSRQFGATGAPARPDWVRADGIVDFAKIPEKVNVVGRDGMPTGLTVNLRLLMASPTAASDHATDRDPAGVVRTYSTTYDEHGNQSHTEHAALTDTYRGLVEPRR